MPLARLLLLVCCAALLGLAAAAAPETAGLGPVEAWRGLGFRYFRRGPGGEKLHIKRLRGAGPGAR